MIILIYVDVMLCMCLSPLSAAMPLHLSLLKKHRQRFQLGKYLCANGLQTRLPGAFPE
jgi:hypothetical protein